MNTQKATDEAAGGEVFSSQAPRQGEEATNQKEHLITPRQLCERLQISRVTGWKLVAERGLRCIKIGRSVRIRESDLEAWLERNTREGGAE